ncbi:deoxyribose-phosphate aldolase 4 [Acidaminococcus sp. CAG:917]|nr:deoxyribose-phosphate aldolase 4 [Acidaminococcus sp. CAG:917]
MVINVGALKDGLTNFVLEDIKGVVNAGVPVKVILETAKLTDSEIALATELAVKAGAAFIKTSTGFMGEGATEHAVAYMVKCAAGRIKVKASGGIRTVEAAKRYIELGAERIGASNLS